jgi:tetratricopeptide (TPR) repeat protein
VNQHLSEAQLERFLARRLSPADAGNTARHLLAGCRLCGSKLLQMAPSSHLQKEVDEATAASLRDRALASALRQEVQQKVEQERLALSLDLLRQSPKSAGPVRRAQVESGPEVAESLLRHSFELRFRDPQAMRWLAYNAVKAIESLPPEGSSQARFDLQARTWASLANGYRVNNELAEAAAAFDRARAALRQGSGSLKLLAHLAVLEGSFKVSQGNLTAASQLLDGAYRLYMRLRDRHLVGRTLISLGTCLEHQGQSLKALQILQQGLSLLDPSRDPSLRPIAQLNALYALVSSGNHQEGGKLLLKSGLRQAFSGDPLNLLRIRWSEGRLMGGLDKLPRAGTTLLGVRADFLDLGLGFDAALVLQDLLPILLRHGKFGDLRRNAQECYITFRDLGVHREAARAKAYLV